MKRHLFRPRCGLRFGFRFERALTAALIIASALIGGFSGPAGANDVFTVSEIMVDATAQTASVAREAALTSGQARALERLYRRLVVKQDWPRLPDPAPATAAELVRDFSVDDERTSAVRYLASMTVRFSAEAVRRHLRNLGVDFAETRSKPVLVLPVFEQAGAVALWDSPNPWRQAWETIDLDTGLVPLIRPLGDLRDISQVGAEQAVRGDRDRLDPLAARYGAGSVMVAVAETRQGGEAVAVNLLHHKGEQTERSRLGVFPLDPAQDRLAAFSRVARDVASTIEENWKRDNILQFDHAQELTVDIPLSSLNQWLTVDRRLRDIASIRESRLVYLSKELARVRLSFIGRVDQLVVALAQNDLTLDQGAVSWVLSPSSAGENTGTGR